MISIICGTNRPNSLTRVYAEQFLQLFKEELEVEAQMLSLEDFPEGTIHPGMYEAEKQSKHLSELQDQYMLGADAFLIVMPEYNGSFPGILKTFIDACSIREYKNTFTGKKVALFGVSSGRAGNLRGIDHLTGVMNHVGSVVMPKAIPYGQSNKFLDEERKISDKATLEMMEGYAKQFVNFIASYSHTSSVG